MSMHVEIGARRFRAAAIGCLAAASVTAALVERVAAHPHVWVVARATLIVENGAVAGVRHRWSFDEGYTKMAIEGLDADGDGTYSKQELAELAQVNVEGLKEFGYFTEVRLGDQKLAVADPKTYHLEYAADSGLVLDFIVPFPKPVLLESKDFRVSVGDPTAFIDFKFAKDRPVTLSEGAPAACQAAVAPPKAVADDTARLGQAFGEQFAGAVMLGMMQDISVTCTAADGNATPAAK